MWISTNNFTGQIHIGDNI